MNREDLHLPRAVFSFALAAVLGAWACTPSALVLEVGDAGSDLIADSGEPPAGNRDGGDAGGLDAAVPDAGHAGDAGAPDGSTPDSGVPDAGVLDAGVPDAGSPPRAMGVNMPNLLHLYLGTAPGGAFAARTQMDAARARGISHARFTASGYWPSEMKSGSGWVNNPAAYWAAFDQLVADAEARDLKLVPSLLFQLYLFPDLANEPVGKLFTPGSATRLLAEQYVSEVVTRYRARPVILFWELGNEANLLADLDLSSCNVCAGNTSACGSLAPPLGTPCLRTAADNFFSCNSCRGVSSAQQDLGEFVAAIATLVKSLDPSRSFASGFAHPRASATHLAKTPCPPCDWTADSPAEYEQALAQLHPAPVDLVTVHHYPEAGRFGSTDEAGLALLERAGAWAAAQGKRLYVGEYGEPRAGSVSCGGSTEVCGGDADRVFTRRVLNELVEQAVPYSALWAFDFYQFCAGVPSCYTVEASESIMEQYVQHDLAEHACAGRSDGAGCPIGECAQGRCRPLPVSWTGLDVAGDESAFVTWTNCAGGAPGSVQRIAAGGGGFLRLSSPAFSTGGTCQFPGLYSLTLKAATQPGRALVHFVARSSGTGAQIRLLVFDANDAEIAAASASVASDPAFRAGGLWASLPAGAAKVALRIELSQPNATLDVDELGVVWQP